jgi:hypothetical protein
MRRAQLYGLGNVVSCLLSTLVGDLASVWLGLQETVHAHAVGRMSDCKLRRCELWVWCNHKAGCDDAGDFSGVYPYHGCQLMQVPKDSMPQDWDRGPSFSSFQSGYITGVFSGPALIASHRPNCRSVPWHSAK